MKRFISIVLLFVMLVYILHLIDAKEKETVYNMCLTSYNIGGLDKRLNDSKSPWSTQRLVARKKAIKQHCELKAYSHISVFIGI